MSLLILALSGALNTFQGFAPVPLIVTVSAVNYDGAICVTVDGPEFHKSCVGRSKGSARVRAYPFTLGAPGLYEVTVEDNRGQKWTGMTVEVL